MTKYDIDNQPTDAELNALADFFHRMAGIAEGDAWMKLYLDAAEVLTDVIAAWRGEIEP